MPKTLQCEHCKADFTVSPSVRKRFCSVGCYNEATGRVRVDRTCEQCGVSFTAKPGRADQRFCGHDCMYENRRATDWRGFTGPKPGWENPRKLPRAQRECEWCGASFEILASRIGKNGQGKFCTVNCASAHNVRYAQNRVSKAEERFVAFLNDNGLHPETQVQFSHFIVDAMFRDERVAVEFDGDYWHDLPRMKEKDSRKDAALRKAGYTIIRVRQTVHEADPADTLRRIVETLAQPCQRAA